MIMATRLLSRSRTLFTTNKQTLTSYLLSRPFASASKFSLLRLRPIASTMGGIFLSPTNAFRGFATVESENSPSDNNSNLSNRLPKEDISLDGCDFEHWFIVVENPPENATRDEIIDSYIKTLAQVVGSEEEARMKIYSISTKHYFAFGALLSQELSQKLKDLPNVQWVLPDSYLDARTKDYGGEPFVNGQALPYDPKYHEEWVKNHANAQERDRRYDRPRNADRLRNYRRQETRNPSPGPAAAAAAPPNTEGPGGNVGGPSPNSNNPGYAPNIN